MKAMAHKPASRSQPWALPQLVELVTYLSSCGPHVYSLSGMHTWPLRMRLSVKRSNMQSPYLRSIQVAHPCACRIRGTPGRDQGAMHMRSRCMRSGAPAGASAGPHASRALAREHGATDP